MGDKKVSEDKRFKTLIDVLILSIGPILAYLLTYSYEYGYTKHFKIPTELISPNITNIFIVGVAFWSIFIPVIFLCNIFLISFGKVNNIYHRTLLRLSPMYLIFFIYFLIYGFNTLIAYISVLILLFTLWEFFFPILFFRNIKGYKEKLKKQEEKEESVKNILDKIRANLGQSGVLLIFVIYVSIITAYNLGVSKAISQKEFLLLEKQQMVVLRIYGDRLICAPINIENKEIDNKIKIYHINNPTISLKWSKVGPLTYNK